MHRDNRLRAAATLVLAALPLTAVPAAAQGQTHLASVGALDLGDKSIAQSARVGAMARQRAPEGRKVLSDFTEGKGRWRFVAAALALAAVIEALHRLRERRRLELEAVRTRIATDLHDDIGSNLSRIAILTEIARRDLDGCSPAVEERLAHIASVSRDLVDSMSDIVWAVNPARDQLHDLTRRMRHFADDVLSARDIELRFRCPEDGHHMLLGTDTRREVYLVFKEAVNNVARHSACRSAEINLAIDDGWLAIHVSDDGRGFETTVVAETGGNGIASMTRRAKRIGGTLNVVSQPGTGTTLTLQVPLGRRNWAFRLLGRAIPARRPQRDRDSRLPDEGMERNGARQTPGGPPLIAVQLGSANPRGDPGSSLGLTWTSRPPRSSCRVPQSSTKSPNVKRMGGALFQALFRRP